MNNKSKSRSVFPRHNHNKPTVSLSNIHYIQMCYTVDYNQPGLLRLMLASGTDHNPFLNFLYQDFNLKLISNTIRLPPWLHGWAARLVMGGGQDFCAKLHGNRKKIFGLCAKSEKFVLGLGPPCPPPEGKLCGSMKALLSFHY